MSQAEEFAAGKVTGITKFGAFVKLEDGRSGLVHISEVANTYVDDVSKHLKVGQDVKVKVLSVDDKGRINLSIKQALPREERPVKKPVDPTGRVVRPAVETSFEESYTPEGDELDLGQDVYDFVCISLPIQRVHPEGECNQETTKYLSK